MSAQTAISTQSVRPSGSSNVAGNPEPSSIQVAIKPADFIAAQKRAAEIREAEAAKQAFDRARATRDYGWGGWVQYGLFNKVSGLLSEENQTKLDLYNKHTELLSKIERVKKACRKFIAAEKVVEATKDPQAVKRAEEVECRKAHKLRDRYNELIAFAVEQARELKILRTTYKADVHERLGQESQDLIFHTLHRVAGKFCLPADRLQLTEGFEAAYVEAVSKLVQYTQYAHTASGDQLSVQKIVEAFIEGLASMPEFVQDRSKVIDCYERVVKLRYPDIETDAVAKTSIEQTKSEMEKKIIEDFAGQLNDLMDKETEITLDDIRQITSHGISLFQWREFTDAEVEILNFLKARKKELVFTKELLQSNCEMIAIAKEIFAQEHTFTVRDICEFFGFCLKTPQVLTLIAQQLQTVSKDPSIPLVGFDEFKQVTQSLVEIEQKMTALTAEADSEIQKLSQQVKGQKDKVDELNEKEVQLREAITAQLDTISSSEQELSIYREKFQKGQQELQSLNDKERHFIELIYGSDIVQSVRTKNSENLKKKEELIDQQKADLQLLQIKMGDLQVVQGEASDTLEEMVELQSKAQTNYSKSLLALKQERSQLSQKSLNLSGLTIGVIGRCLEIRDVPRFITVTQNATLANALTTYLEMEGFKDEREQDGHLISKLTGEMQTQCSLLGLKYDEGADRFVFQASEENQIKKYVDSNLDITAEVTARLLDVRTGTQKRPTFFRQLISRSESEEDKKFRLSMGGDGLYDVIASRIYTTFAPRVTLEELLF